VTLLRTTIALAVALAPVVACAGKADPSVVSYTLKFPSVEAAIASEQVQVLVFDAPTDPAARAADCNEKIARRLRRDPITPIQASEPVSMCEMFLRKPRFEVPFGEKVIFAITQKRGQDFLLGCALQTLGDGDAPVPITLSLADIANPVPLTECATVSDFCASKCK
jgi:hypothetical protein